MQAMSDKRLDEVTKTILECIEALRPVAEHQKDRHALNGLLTQSALLNNLGKRIESHQLPDGYVRSVINDVRLDTLLVLTDLMVSLTFQKQELAAPTEKLRLEAHERRAAVDGDQDDERRVQSKEPMSHVVPDLQVLVKIESCLRGCMLQETV